MQQVSDSKQLKDRVWAKCYREYAVERKRIIEEAKNGNKNISFYRVAILQELLDFIDTRDVDDDTYQRAFAKLDKKKFPLEYLWDIYIEMPDELYNTFKEVFNIIEEG